MSRIIYITGSLFAMTALASCKKSDSYDVKGEEKVKFYTRNETAGNAPPNSITYSVVNYPDPAGTGWLNLSTSLSSAIKFPVFATKPVSQDVEVRAALDNSMVAAYNAAHNTNYEPLPVAVLNTDGILKAKILKGDTRSSDSISIPTNLTHYQNYKDTLLPGDAQQLQLPLLPKYGYNFHRYYLTQQFPWKRNLICNSDQMLSSLFLFRRALQAPLLPIYQYNHRRC